MLNTAISTDVQVPFVKRASYTIHIDGAHSYVEFDTSPWLCYEQRELKLLYETARQTIFTIKQL